MSDRLKITLVFLMAFAMAGCDDHYRYFCQNPRNWEKIDCKSPICTASGTCPDELRTPGAEK
jgi:outer membrane lipopolysaccharide assembly protein LptE/RlpB